MWNRGGQRTAAKDDHGRLCRCFDRLVVHRPAHNDASGIWAAVVVQRHAVPAGQACTWIKCAGHLMSATMSMLRLGLLLYVKKYSMSPIEPSVKAGQYTGMPFRAAQ